MVLFSPAHSNALLLCVAQASGHPLRATGLGVHEGAEPFSGAGAGAGEGLEEGETEEGEATREGTGGG